MAKFDLHHSIETKTAFPMYTFFAEGTHAGEIIDTLGYEGIQYVITSGTLTTGTFTPWIEEGNQSNLSVATPVDTSHLLGTYADATFLVADDDVTKMIGNVGQKRYQRLMITGTDAPAGTLIATAILHSALHQPTNGANKSTG